MLYQDRDLAYFECYNIAKCMLTCAIPFVTINVLFPNIFSFHPPLRHTLNFMISAWYIFQLSYSLPHTCTQLSYYFVIFITDTTFCTGQCWFLQPLYPSSIHGLPVETFSGTKIMPASGKNPPMWTNLFLHSLVLVRNSFKSSSPYFHLPWCGPG